MSLSQDPDQLSNDLKDLQSAADPGSVPNPGSGPHMRTVGSSGISEITPYYCHIPDNGALPGHYMGLAEKDKSAIYTEIPPHPEGALPENPGDVNTDSTGSIKIQD